MSDNVELVRRSFGTEGERRVWDEDMVRRFADEIWADDILYVEADEWPGSGTYTGRAAVLERLGEYRDVLGAPETEVEEIFALDEELVLVVWRYASVASSGVPLEQRWAYLFTVSEGRLVRWQALMDVDRALREFGIA